MDSRIVAVVAVVALLAGCVRHELRATPSELEAARHLLRTQPTAPVKTEDGRVASIALDQRVEIVDTRGVRFPLTVREVVRDCPAHAPDPNRLCQLHGIERVVVGERKEVATSVWAVPVGLLTLGGIVGIGACAAGCPSPYQEITLVGLGVLGILILRGIAKHGIAR